MKERLEYLLKENNVSDLTITYHCQYCGRKKVPVKKVKSMGHSRSSGKPMYKFVAWLRCPKWWHRWFDWLMDRDEEFVWELHLENYWYLEEIDKSPYPFVSY